MTTTPKQQAEELAGQVANRLGFKLSRDEIVSVIVEELRLESLLADKAMLDYLSIHSANNRLFIEVNSVMLVNPPNFRQAITSVMKEQEE